MQNIVESRFFVLINQSFSNENETSQELMGSWTSSFHEPHFWTKLSRVFFFNVRKKACLCFLNIGHSFSFDSVRKRVIEHQVSFLLKNRQKRNVRYETQKWIKMRLFVFVFINQILTTLRGKNEKNLHACLFPRAGPLPICPHFAELELSLFISFSESFENSQGYSTAGFCKMCVGRNTYIAYNFYSFHSKYFQRKHPPPPSPSASI